MENSPNPNKKNASNSIKKQCKSSNNDNNNSSNKNKLNNYYQNLLYFSKKILEAKHSITPELYQKIILNNLITKKRTHYFAYINELAITTNVLKEQLKRYYTYEESQTRVPKYVSYYQNYLKFFCKPIFTDYFMNGKMVKHMEKVAQVFYNENYADEDDNNEFNEEKKTKCNFKIFSKTINNEIDNYANFTKVDNDNTDNNKILEAIKKNKRNKDEDLELEMNNINDNSKMNKNKLKFRNNDLDMLENIYKITPILDNEKIKSIEQEKNDNASYNNEDDMKNTEMDSYQKILNEITNKKKGKNNNRDNIFKKSPLFSHNSSVFDYFNSLSIMLFGKKKKGFINKNNSLNNKFKKKDKNNNSNKIINNININIKHLTIGQKSVNPLSEINNLYNNFLIKKEKKRITKSRKHNSMILRDKSFKKYITHFGNHTSKNLEHKKRNDSFGIFQPPKAIIGYNSNYNNNNSNYKKISTINTNSFVTNTRNKSKLKGVNPGKLNIGCITSMNKNKKNSYIKNQTGKMTIYTNSIQNNNHTNFSKNNYSLKNLFNLTNSSNSKIFKELNNKSLNFNTNINNNLRNNLSSLALYKKSLAVISPLLYTKKYKNSNISLNKGITPMSFERVRTTSHKSSHKNLGNINYNNNIISPKNTLNNNKNRNNAKSHANLRSPINIENNGNKRKYNSILFKNKMKDEQQNNSKVINLKYKNYVKFNGLKKNVKNINKKYQSYNKGKKNNNDKKK